MKFSAVTILQGANFTFSYWFLRGLYNSTALPCLWLICPYFYQVLYTVMSTMHFAVMCRAKASRDRGRHTTGRVAAGAVETGQWNHSSFDGADEPNTTGSKSVVYCAIISCFITFTFMWWRHLYFILSDIDKNMNSEINIFSQSSSATCSDVSKFVVDVFAEELTFFLPSVLHQKGSIVLVLRALSILISK